MPKVKIAELIFNFQLYPRNHIEDFNVQSIARSLEAGFTIPPIIADRKTKQIVDGFNRTTAVRKLYGDFAEIDVEWRDYKSEKAMFEDAMLTNTAHGVRLNSHDMARCAIIAKQLHIDNKRLAECLHAKPEWVDKLRKRKVAEGPEGPMAVKGTLAHLAKAQNNAIEAGRDPKPFTQKQVKANEESSGMNWWFILDKAISLFEGGIVPIGHEKAIDRVKHIAELAKAWIEKAERAA